MIKKKICMLGSFAVGKTSLVQRFVKSIFSEKYLTTVGVKIDNKTVSVSGQEVMLVLWDIYGEDEFQKLKMSYLRGASGYLLVVDGTRKATLDKALEIKEKTDSVLGDVPFIILLNKSDLVDEWELDDSVVEELSDKGWLVIRSSAKTEMGVEKAFLTLAEKMVGG
jgi:small GTP-binding protein